MAAYWQGIYLFFIFGKIETIHCLFVIYNQQTMNSHTFDQRSWRLIKDFAGIYGVKMDYSKIKNLTASTISHAMKYGKEYSKNGYMSRAGAWKKFLLKKISKGLKSRQFYEEIAEIIAMQDKVTKEYRLQYERFLQHDRTYHYVAQTKPVMMYTPRTIKTPQ